MKNLEKKSNPNKHIRTTLRLTEQEQKEMEKLIEVLGAENKSEVLRTGLKQLVEKYL